MKRTTTTWTCERCKKEEEVEQAKQPTGWGRVSIAEPPESAEPKSEGDFCGNCIYDIRVTVRNPAPETIQA